ncbi:hypothetical protein ABFA07_022299 [Porites harrisoni]
MIMKTVVVLTLAFVACFMLQPVEPLPAPIIEVGCNQYCAKPPHCPPGNNVCRTSICPPGTQCVACPCDCVNVLCIH